MIIVLTTILTATLAIGAAPNEPAWTFATPVAAPANRPAAAELADQAATAKTPMESASLHLAAANEFLAVALAPMASRAMLEIPAADDVTAARSVLADAQQHLAAAEAALARITPATGDADDAALRRIQEQLATVRSFERAAQALWGERESEAESADAMRDAAFDLSTRMEDPNADVANTARLWRAFLFERRGDASRAFDLLPTELGPPSGDPSVALYLRIMRCRLFARLQSSYPAALALSNRLEGQSPSWFKDAEAAAGARRTVAYLRRGLLRDWGAALTRAGQADRAAWCSAAIQRMDQEYFTAPQVPELLPLSWAAPRVVPIAPATTAEQTPEASSNGENGGSAPVAPAPEATTNGTSPE